MNDSKMKVLQAYLWFICAFHIVIGAGLNLFPGMASVMAEVYGAEIESSAQFDYILKPLGAFMFVMGLLAAAAALKPVQYRAVIYGFAALFAIRALQRLVFAQEIMDTFTISASRNMANMVFFFAMAIALIVLERLVNRSGTDAAPA